MAKYKFEVEVEFDQDISLEGTNEVTDNILDALEAQVATGWIAPLCEGITLKITVTNPLTLYHDYKEPGKYE